MANEVFNLFHPITKRWFSESIGEPTAVQQEAWPAIASGSHTLVSAPTGTGKTLSAFLIFIDRLKAMAREDSLRQELQLIYVSPLKSLAGDIRENLRRPLSGIYEEERKCGNLPNSTPYDISVAIRTGDTPQEERRRMIKKPPHVLITTPESLYLLLTSKSGQTILRTASAIIIDELHALIDSKRGAHLMLSLARLDKLCGKPLQRIGLSATIEPLIMAAEYLSPDPVRIVAPKMKKKVELIITNPRSHPEMIQRQPIWNEVAATVYEHCRNARSVIAFVEGRAYAEKLAYYVNQIAGDDFARTHHGSLSKEQRLEVEQDLREGNLRLLCATSSMELGIDVGEIDLVFQIGTPRSISSTLQRLGRAGHNPGRTSVMHIIPRTASECLYSGLTAEVVRQGEVEYCHPPRLCLDVLAQHLVSMATGDGYDVDEVLELLPRAYPFREVTKEEVLDVLAMLAGDYEHERNLPVRPRILYDRIHGHVEGDPYSRMLAVSAGGTIPDMGLYTIKTEQGVKLGELDEEYVFEARVGDKFLLGSFAWKISNIQKDSVIVTQSNVIGARPPFWKGDIRGRRMQTGLAFGELFSRLGEAYRKDTLLSELCKFGIEESAAQEVKAYLERQIEATKVLPDDKTIIIEHFRDETGNPQMMVHSLFGRGINSPLALLTAQIAKHQLNTNVNLVEDDDGFLLFPYGEAPLPEGLLYRITPDTAKAVLEAMILSTPLFNMTFRYNAARALMMGVRKAGRQPLWVQRLRSAQMLDSIIQFKNHPLIRETKRECLEDYWDLSGVEMVLRGIQSGSIAVYEMHLDHPSPMSLSLRQQTEASMMYDYAPTPMKVHMAAEEALEQSQMIAPSPEQLAKVSQRKRLPEDEKQLHSLLMIEGDIIAGELEIPIDWLETLANQGRVKYIEPGLWIASEQEDKYKAALMDGDWEARKQIVLRLLRYRGEQSPDMIEERYLWKKETSEELLHGLCRVGEVIESEGMYYHKELYHRARIETIKSRRNQIRTLPPERYAALLTNCMRLPASPGDQLEAALTRMCGQVYEVSLWENVLLPARVRGYRPELMEQLLAQGKLFWRILPGKGLGFYRYEDIDWEQDMAANLAELDGEERILYEALLKRGACFMPALSGLLGGVSPFETLLKLAGKGFVCADSFMPVRQWLNQDRIGKGNVKQRVAARARAQTTGRWELCRPIRELSVEQLLERNFDRVVLLSRETLQDLSWVTALETLRIWEYTGRVRRGYFVEGLSGIQFIRDADFTAAMLALEQPGDQIQWLSAVDPAQPWGKSLNHMPGRSFLNIPGTAVALRGGIPVAILERQGKVLRVYEHSYCSEVIDAFAQDFRQKRLYTTLKRITVKDYPDNARDALAGAGFVKEMQDYVLYQGYQ